MKNSILSLFILLFSLSATAQEWAKMMQDPDVNFYEVQDAFNAEWEGKDPIRGKGWKQFKRWEDFMEPRVFPNGNRIQSELYYEAWKQAERHQSEVSTERENADWEPVGPTSWVSQGWNPGLGRINMVVKHPTDDDVIYVGTPAGGLWRSDNAGTSWTPMTDNLPAIGVSGLAINPEDTDIMYLATGDGDGGDTYSIGVLKTTDGGQNWEETNLNFEVSNGVRCSKILMNPNDYNTLWVVTNIGVYLTNDAGQTWSLAQNGNFKDLEINPNNSDIIYISGSRFYKSTDGGQIFTPISNTLPSNNDVNRMAIAVTADNPNLVYLVASDDEDNGFYGLYRSSDQGDSFELMSDSPNILTYSQVGEGDGGQGWYDLAIAASPTDENQIFVGGINVWKSDNGGANWNIVSHWNYPPNISYVHADIHSLDFYGNDLYCGNDGGVFLTEDEGNSWSDMSEGLQISQFYRIAVSTTDPELILTASQDNGTNLFSNGDTYTHLLGGDGNAAAINYDNDDIMYSAYPNGSFRKSTNGGQSFTGFSDGIEEDGAWVTPLEFHPTNPDILFAAYENVWKNVNNTWIQLADVPSLGTMRSLDIAPSDPDVIYTATLESIFKTVDGGNDWENISTGLPNLSITDIEVHPENPDILWVTFSGYNDGSKVYKSVNGGDNWTNVSELIPNIPVNCITYQIGSDDGLYIGTDVGVYYKNAAATGWTPFNEGLPNVIINQIVVHYGSNKLFLATYGRGVWTNDFFDISTIMPVANFTTDAELICEGEVINYSNESSNTTGNPMWTFEGGTPAQSTEMDVAVTYENEGVYSAKLVVQNDNGLDSLIQENFITVLGNTGVAGPIQEGFEGISELQDISWYTINDDQDVTWSINDGVGFESDQSVWMNNYNSGPLNEDILLTESYDLSQMDTAFIVMKVAYAERPGSGLERLKVEISTDCGENWDFKKLFTSSNQLPSADPTDDPFIPSGSDEWNVLVVDNIEPEERTDNLRVRMIFRSNNGNNIYVDNVNIVEDINTGIIDHELELTNIEVFPNPVENGLTTLNIQSVKSEEIQIDLVDVLGRNLSSLWTGRLHEGDNQIPLEIKNTPAGFYSIVVRTDSKIIGSTPVVVE